MTSSPLVPKNGWAAARVAKTAGTIAVKAIARIAAFFLFPMMQKTSLWRSLVTTRERPRWWMNFVLRRRSGAFSLGRIEGCDAVVARQIEPFSVRDDRVVGAATTMEDDLARAHVCPEGGFRVEVSVVGDVPDDGHPARDAAARLLTPARGAGAGVEGVES